jgi:hypothetical protein
VQPATPLGADQVNVLNAFYHCFDQEHKGVSPEEYTTMSHWQEIMGVARQKGIQFDAREFNEEKDADYIRMRMIAIWEGKETMGRGTGRLDVGPIDFLAYGRRRREAAPESKGFCRTLNSKKR